MDKIKRHSTFPPLTFDFTDDAGNHIDCTLFEVRFVVKNRKGTVVINELIGGEGSPAVWTDIKTGQGEYRWRVEDTANTGKYSYEFKFTRLYDNRKFSLPEGDYLYFLIVEDIQI